MKRILSAIFASLLLATAPAWAGGDHGNGKHHDKWEQKQWKKDRKAWEKEHKHWAKHGHAVREREVVNNYYYPAQPVVEHRYYVERTYSPAIVAAPGVVAAPGIVSAPGVFIGFSN